MRLNFRKISAITSSALMLGMSIASPVIAANYPGPFVVGGSADVAIVYGTGEGVSALDLVQASNIQSNLQSQMGSSGGTTATVTGEAYALFTSSSKLWMNETLQSVRSTLTDSELPTVLADGDFDGDVSVDTTQTIEIGTVPLIVFGQHPTSDDDPTVAVRLVESSEFKNYIYNMTVTFSQATNMTSSDSIGESMNIFGKTYTVGAGTTLKKLYLYESSETVALSIGGSDPTSATVTVAGSEYTVELIGATDTTATVKVTDSSGGYTSKEISEDQSKKVQGIDVAVNLADEDTATNRLLAEITVGTNKLLLQEGSNVKQGSDEDSIKGTKVHFASGKKGCHNMTSFEISVTAEDADEDAILPGASFIDPVFGSFKIDFSSLAEDDDREDIIISGSSTDKATLELATHDGTGKITWYNNDSQVAELSDSTKDDIFHVLEQEEIAYTQYVAVGNEDEGYLLEFYEFDNDSGSTSDTIKFRNAFDSTDTYSVTGIATEGTGTLTVGGKAHTVNYTGTSTSNAAVRIDYKDTNGYNLTVFPTIQTSKGAKLAFYNETYLDLSDMDGEGHDVGGLVFPDGDGYTGIPVIYHYCAGAGKNNTWNVGGTLVNLTSTSNGSIITIGELKYQVNGSSGGHGNSTVIRLMQPDGDAIVTHPGIIIFEEKAQSAADSGSDDKYHAMFVLMDNQAGSSTKKIGVSDVQFTYKNDAPYSFGEDWDDIQLESDDDIYYSYDLWGTLIVTDKSDSDQYSTTIKYPNDQVSASIYVAEQSATITGGSSGGVTSLGEVLVKDTEVSSVSTKNLIVVGGSCINSAAASLIGGGYCGSGWTDQTSVGSGQFLIQSFGAADQSLTSKIALLVAGYEAADTVNAAKYLTTQSVDTAAGKKYIGTSSTSAELQATSA